MFDMKMVSALCGMFSLSFLFAASAGHGGASIDTERIYLSGHGCDDAVGWEFSLDGGEAAILPVPSCWEAQGFGKLQYGYNLKCGNKKHGSESAADELGVYRHVFRIPERVKGSRVDIVFEAVMTDCEVSLNGRPIGSHQGGYTTFKLDATDALNFVGKNELVVKVWKVSRNKSVNSAERTGDYWLFGGIWRPVYLEVKPPKFIDYVTVDARADGTLKADIHVSDGSVRHLEEKWENPRLWTAETPNLYEKAFELKDEAGNVIHRVIKKIGFRTIEAKRGGEFRINGRRVFVKGVNRHSFRPETGRTLSRAKNLEDVLLIKSMNMNAVRLSHYPADPTFLDLCDEYGLYVENELLGWQNCVDAVVGTNLVREVVTRDQAHPSVIWWSNGNEGGWNTALDALFDELDPSRRPLLHPWAEFRDFHCKHYRNYKDTKEFLRGDWLFMPTEFQHGLYDGGHAAGLGELWELFRRSKHGVGGFLWDFMDAAMPSFAAATEDKPMAGRGVPGALDCQGSKGADGILGPHGEKSGSYWAVREIWSPVKLTLKEGKVEVENRYDFLGDDAFTVKEEVVSFDGVKALKVTATDAAGGEILSKCWDLGEGGGPRFVAAADGTKPVPPSVSAFPIPRLIALYGSNTTRNQTFSDVPAGFSYIATTNADNSVDVAWEIECTNAVDILGVTFDIDETQVAAKRWLGNGPYRVWRNRPEGVNFGIWENAYNDTIPGVSWDYPEFKGFFSGVRWMELKMKNGDILRMQVMGKPRFVGVFSPRDGLDNLLYTLPRLGLSVLEIVPAIGNKCSGAKKTAPSAKSVVPPRKVVGKVRFSIH